MQDDPIDVLFICTSNSARSLIAESVLRKLGGERFRVYSAGSKPKSEPNPHALSVLRHAGFPTDGLTPKHWDAFAGPDAPIIDFIFTLCDEAAGERCPSWNAQPITAHWSLPDPVKVEGANWEVERAFVDTLRMLRRRIEAFVALPLGKTDRTVLTRQVSEIGKDGAVDERGHAA